MEFYENLIDFYRFQAISKILWFRGRLLRGETRKDLTRSIWPWVGVINPLLTLEVIFPRIKSPGRKNYVWILLVSWPYTPLPSSHRASSCFAMRAWRSLFGTVDCMSTVLLNKSMAVLSIAASLLSVRLEPFSWAGRAAQSSVLQVLDFPAHGAPWV